jgi:hypothetical protein
MSSPQPNINLALNTITTVPTGQLPADQISWIEFINHSPFLCQLVLQGFVLFIPAWYYYPVQMQNENGSPYSNYSFPITIHPIQQTIPGSGFTATFSTIVYGKGEAPPLRIPQTLGGGPVDLTIATTVVNTGQPSGNSFLSATPAGDSGGPAVNIQNNGRKRWGIQQIAEYFSSPVAAMLPRKYRRHRSQ